MAEQLQLDFTQSTTQRARQAEKNRDQLTLFASWAPNIDIALHSPTEAVAHIAGKETDRGADWLRGIVGSARAIKRRRLAFPVTRLDKLGWVRPPAKITLDAATHAIACAMHAHALGYKPLKVEKVGRRVVGKSPRGWPAGLRVTDVPWNAIEALLNTDIPLTIDKSAEEAVAKKLDKAGTEVAKATLSGNSILLTTSRPTLLEGRGLPALSYVGESGDGTYRMPLLLGKAVLEDKTIKVDAKAEAAIKRATKEKGPLIIDDPDFPWTLYDFQATDASTAQRILRATGGVLLAGDMGSGKNLRVSCEVATPTGMRKMGDLQVGDEVIAPDGEPTRVRGVYPHSDWDLYKITFSDGTCTYAGEEHRWWVQTPAQKYRGIPGQVKTTGELLAAGLKEKSGNRKFYIPMAEPLQFNQKDLPVPPYTLGALLGDGSFTGEAIRLADDDGDVKDQVAQELIELPKFRGLSFTPIRQRGKLNSWRLTGAHTLKDELQGLGVWGHRAWEKAVPDPYLYSSVDDRLALLQGLLDTDGSCYGHKKAVGNHQAHAGHVEYTSTSENLCDAVVWLAQSLGGTATKSGPRKTSYTYKGVKKFGRPSWRVRVSLPDTIEPFRIAVKADRYTPRTKYQPTRGIESIEYWGKDDAVCIEVEHPSHQFVIEHGIVTMNTTVSLGLAHAEELLDSALVVTPLSAVSTWQRQISEMGKSFYLATGSPKKDWAAIAENDYDVYVVTYDRLDTFSEILRTKNLKVIIADELQRAKNAGSRRSRALRNMASSVPYRIGLSGTPLTNGLGDILAQGSFLVPTEFPPRASQKSLSDRYATEDPIQGLTDHLHSVMVRRKMSDVGKEMPKREDRRVYVNLTEEQRAAIRDLEEEAKKAKEDGEFEGPNGKMNALTRLQKVRAIVANPVDTGVGGRNVKMDATIKIIQGVLSEGRKAVVFIMDRPSFIEAGKRLDALGIKWGGIWGGTPADERVEVEKRLHRGEIDVVLGSSAAQESWTASPTASVCIFLNASYSYASNSQAEARVYRLNADLNGPPIQIIYVHAKDPTGEASSDDRLQEILDTKKAMFAQVIDREEASLDVNVSNSLSDLLYMLTGEENESLEKLEKDEQRAADEAKRRKEHAKATLYKNKGKNKSDGNLVVDDGSTTVARDER